MHHLNKGKQMYENVNKDKQSRDSLKSMKSLRKFELCEKV